MIFATDKAGTRLSLSCIPAESLWLLLCQNFWDGSIHVLLSAQERWLTFSICMVTTSILSTCAKIRPIVFKRNLVFLKRDRGHWLQVPRDGAVTASLRRHEIKQRFAEACAAAGQQHSPVWERLQKLCGDTQTLVPRWDCLSHRAPGWRLVTWGMEQCRWRDRRSGRGAVGQQLPQGFGCAPPSAGHVHRWLCPHRGTLHCLQAMLPQPDNDGFALMTHSGSHMLLIILSFAFWCALPLPRDLFLSDFTFILSSLTC